MSDTPALTPGARLASAVCSTEVVVVQASDPNAVVECGGEPMVAAGSASAGSGTPRSGFDTGTLIGKRYGGPDAPVELLCVKAGAGTLSVNSTVLELRSAKPLPASD
jgi:hypothetical protein